MSEFLKELTSVQKADQGYIRLPSGVIIQWSHGLSNASGQAYIDNPIVFPNGFLRGFASYQAGTLTPIICNIGPCTAAASNAWICNTSGIGVENAVINFLLIGH